MLHAVMEFPLVLKGSNDSSNTQDASFLGCQKWPDPLDAARTCIENVS